MPFSTPRPRRRGRALLAGLAVSLAGVAGFAVLPGVDRAGAAPLAAASVTSGGYTTSASSASAARGTTVTITATVSSSSSRRALVDVEIYSGNRLVSQRYWDAQQFSAGQRRTYSSTWTVPAGEALGGHTVKIGIFGTGWSSLSHWNNNAGTVTVTSAPTATRPPTTTAAPTTTRPPTTTARPTTTAAPTTTRPTTTAPTATRPTTTTAPTATPQGRFVTLPPGSALPSDAECAARVRPAAEIRPANSSYNGATGLTSSSMSGLFSRVTGNFSGTTDEIIQWTACKWGIDEDIVRAQTAKESWWFQSATGDFTSDASRCAPGHPIGGADGVSGQCPESIGVQQVRYTYWSQGFPWAQTSTAYNLDFAMAERRTCFEGQNTWMNTVERGQQYAAGDIWGCVGAWYAGRWHTAPAEEYIAAVKDYLSQRIWEKTEFITYTG